MRSRLGPAISVILTLMNNLIRSYKEIFTRRRVRSLLLGLILIGLAIVFQFYASAYSERVSRNFVRDIFLDNLPVVNLNGIIVEGALAALGGSIILLLSKPRYILFALKASALFIATRAVFISLTHLGIYPGQINPDGAGFFDRIYTGLGLKAGYFFSGHTGLSFLGALVFMKEKFWRYVYIALTAIFGVSVLLAHVHYSIDVFAAPYITYAVFKMSQYFFREDYWLTRSETAS